MLLKLNLLQINDLFIKTLKLYYPVYIIILCGIVVQYTWYQEAELIIGNDTPVIIDPSVYIESLWAIWDDHNALGNLNTQKFVQLIPLGIFYKILTTFNIPYSIEMINRLMLFVLFTGSGISIYLLLKNICEINNIVLLTVAIFYITNPFMMILWTTPGYYLTDYAFFPLILYLFINGIKEKKSLRYVITLSIIWTILVIPGPQSYAITEWLIVVAYTLYFVIITRSRENVIFSLRFLGILFMSWILLNSFWLIPFVYNATNTLSAYQEPSRTKPINLIKSNSVDLVDSLRLSWTKPLDATYKDSYPYEWYHIFYKTNGITIITFIIPMLAAGSMLIYKRKNIMFFALLTIITLFILRGAYDESGLNSFIFSNDFIVTVFRSLQRLLQVLALGYSILIAVSLNDIYNLSKRHNLLRPIPFILIVLIGIIIPWPLWNGDIQDGNALIPSRRASIPTYVYETIEWINKDKDDSNVLHIPYDTRGIMTFKWEYGLQPSSNPFIYGLEKPVLSGNYYIVPLIKDIVNGRVYDSSILNILNIKYILFHKDANWEYIEGHNWWISGDPQSIENNLNNMKGLQKIKEIGNITIYKNTRWEPTVAYISSTPDPLHNKRIILHIEQDNKLYSSNTNIINLTIPYLDGMRKDFSDVSFTTNDGILLPHRIEKVNNKNNSANFLIGIPSLNNFTYIYMYYNSSKGFQYEDESIWQIFNFRQTRNEYFNRLHGMQDCEVIDDKIDGTFLYCKGTKKLTIIDQKKEGIISGIFKFENVTAHHYSVTLIDNKNVWNYLIIALNDGHFGYYSNNAFHHFPIDAIYNPDQWYEIKVYFTFNEKKYYIWINDQLVTPTGLPLLTNGTNMNNWYIVSSNSPTSSMKIKDLRIYLTEPIIVNYTIINKEESNNIQYIHDMKKISKYEYILYINQSGPYYLTFVQRYDPNWQLNIIKPAGIYTGMHLQSSYNLNLWYINQTSNNLIKIVFNKQQIILVETAQILTLISFISFIVYISYYKFRQFIYLQQQ